jgi:hypothetical protein
MEAPANQPESNEILIPREGQLDCILSRVDLAAIVISLLGIGLLGAVVLVMAVIDLAKLLAIFWSQPLDRWLSIVLGLAIIWVVARWKKSRA